jgi:hypothetical protein
LTILFPDYFFSAAAALRGPLRVRAFVRVRWPRTGKTPAVTESTIATDIHQPLDVHRRLSTKITLDRELSDLIANFFKISVRQDP